MRADGSIGMLCAVLLAMGGGAQAQTLQFVDDLPGTFIDISGTGTPLHLDDEDETVFTTTIGNAVFPAGSIVIANNGGVGFANPPSTDLAPENEPLPSNNAFGGGKSLLAFWDDVGNTMGEVYEREDRGRLIIQWNNKPFADSPDICTFQIQVFDTVQGGGIYAQFLYADIERPRPDGGASATIGYQDGGRFNDVQWSYNTPGAVANGTVLSLVPEPSTLVMVLMGGLLILRRR